MKMMRKGRGIRLRLGHRLVKVFKLFVRRRERCRATLKRLKPPSCTSRAMSRLCNWGRLLKHGAKGLCSGRKHSAYIRVGQEPEVKPVSVPKGHLAVYVGDKEDDTCRVVVPVIYFNHPLFADLLSQAEKVYGFNHQGGIQIPCRKSQFDHVKTRIAATTGGRRWHSRWGWNKS